MIKDKGDFIELDVLIEQFKEKTVGVKGEDGKIKKDDVGKRVKEVVQEYTGFKLLPTTFSKEGITLYGPVTNHRNQILKTRSTVYDKFTQKFYIVKHRILEIETTLNQRAIVGFKIR